MRKANDTLKSFKEISNAAENFVEDGNDLLKQFVNKMNHSIFFDGQQKIELFQKWRKELNEALEQAKEKCNEIELVQPK